MALILASASPRRAHLLTEHGYQFEVVPAAVAESSPPHLTVGETVLFNARAKAETVASLRPGEIVLGADTLVACEGQIFGKPARMNEALRMLQHLNGRAHDVFSAVWLVRRATGERRGFVEITRVHFRRLTTARLREYLQRIGPIDKAGAYAAQEDNGELIERFEGSFTNVIGLPMERLAAELAPFTCVQPPSETN